MDVKPLLTSVTLMLEMVKKAHSARKGNNVIKRERERERERERGIIYQFSSTITRSSVSLYSLMNDVLSLQEDNIISIQFFSPVQRQLTILGNFKSQ